MDFQDVQTLPSSDGEDLILIRDVSLSEEGLVTRDQLLASYPKSSASQDTTFRDVTVNSLTASEVDAANLIINGGSAKANSLIRANGTLVLSDIAAGAQELETVAITGLTINHVPLLNISDALPAGLICIPSIRAADTLTVAFFNATASTITAANYTFTAAFLRVVAV